MTTETYEPAGTKELMQDIIAGATKRIFGEEAPPEKFDLMLELPHVVKFGWSAALVYEHDKPVPGRKDEEGKPLKDLHIVKLFRKKEHVTVFAVPMAEKPGDVAKVPPTRYTLLYSGPVVTESMTYAVFKDQLERELVVLFSDTYGELRGGDGEPVAPEEPEIEEPETDPHAPPAT